MLHSEFMSVSGKSRDYQRILPNTERNMSWSACVGSLGSSRKRASLLKEKIFPSFLASRRGCPDELTGQGKRKNPGLENQWVLLASHCSLNSKPSCLLCQKNGLAFLPFSIFLRFHDFVTVWSVSFLHFMGFYYLLPYTTKVLDCEGSNLVICGFLSI